MAAEAGGLTPRDTLLAVMRWHYRAERYDDAARIAAMVAPYIHPRLSCSNVTIKPSLKEIFAAASDEDLRTFIDETKHDIEQLGGEPALAGVKTQGSA